MNAATGSASIPIPLIKWSTRTVTVSYEYEYELVCRTGWMEDWRTDTEYRA